MTLDIFALSGQVRAMSDVVRGDALRLPGRLAQARALLREQAGDWEFWGEEVAKASAKSPFLLAQPLEPMSVVYDAPRCPADYAVAASDGSQIDVDHHGQAICYVVNVGTVALVYGKQPSFAAATRPTLGYLPHELVIQDPATLREYPVEGAVLAAERDLREGLSLAEVALALPDELPRVAVQDGTLIRWSLEQFEPFLQNRFLGDYLSYLETMHALPCPVVSYMSQPRSPDVKGLVQFLAVRGDVRRWREQYPTRAEEPFAGIADHLIFADLLRPGQRSARFASRSRILEHYDQHAIQFFYLKVGNEVARVEFPAWVAEEAYLDLVHAVIYDQTQRGMGYPAVVQRAHEQAVIHDADRQQLRSLIDKVLIQAGVTLGQSAKTASKLRPRV